MAKILKKADLAKLSRMHAELGLMREAVAGANIQGDERGGAAVLEAETALELLTEANNRLGELLRWQSADFVKREAAR